MIRLHRLLEIPPLTRALILLPIIGFFIYFFTIRFNVPWFDEFENIPYFLNRFLTVETFGDRIRALIRPNNEHRVVYARLLVLSQYFLTGGLNFGQLMLWGNLGLVLILILIYWSLRKHEGNASKALIGLLPVPLLLFTAQNYLLTFTAIYTLQYLAIIGLVMLTLYLLTGRKPINLALALGLGLLATFSMGNGMLLWPAGVGTLVLQRRWKTLGIWLVAGAIGIYLYSLGYPVQQGNAEGFTYVMAHPLQTVFGFLVFAGSVFDFFPTLAAENRVHLPFVAGVLIVGWLGYWIIKSLFVTKKNTSFFDAFMLGVALFLLANIALIAVFRIRFYFGMVLHSTYRTYAMVLWAVACVIFYSRLPSTSRERIWPGIWILFLSVNIITYFTYVPMAVERRKFLQGMAYNQINADVGLGGSRNSILARYIADLMTLMHNRGWYSVPIPIIIPDEKKLLEPVRVFATKVPLQVDTRDNYVVVSSNEPGYRTAMNEGAYLIMKSDRYTYLMFATKNRPSGYFPWRLAPGFSIGMPISMIQAGRYRIGMFRTYPDHSDVQFSDQFVQVK